MIDRQIITVPSLSGGVSRQPDHARFADQVEDAINVVFDIAGPARKRPGTRFVKQISSSSVPSQNSTLRAHVIHRDDAEAYIVVYGRDAGSGDIWLEVYDESGTKATTTIASAADAYLDLNDAEADDLRLVTSADVTLIINTTVAASTTFEADFTVTDSFKDVAALKRHTPADETYHYATAEDSYWQYDVDGKTFATAAFATVTGDKASPTGIWDNLTDDPFGLGVRCQRQALSITGGSFTTATKTLTKAGAFASYTHQVGDKINVTGGTGVTPGYYAVASKTDSDSIVLADDIGGTNPADVATDGIAKDFESVSTTTGIALEDMQEVAAAIQEGFGGVEVLVEWVQDSAGAGHFVLTAPFRGSGAKVISTFTPTETHTTDLSASGEAFDDTGWTTTDGTGTVTTSEQTLDVDDRWTEVNEPGAADAGLNTATLPIKLVRTQTSPLKFTADTIDWNARGSGNAETNPSPQLFRAASASGQIEAISAASPGVVTSTAHGLETGDVIHIIDTDSTPILDGKRTVTRLSADTFSVAVNTSGAGTADTGSWTKDGAKIGDAVFFQNRLVLVGGEYVAISQSGDLFNFYAEDPTNIVDSDPIDRRVGGSRVADLIHAIPFRETIVLMSSTGQQFELSAAATLTPTDATIDESTTVNTTAIAPVKMGSLIYFVAEEGNQSVVHEYVFRDDLLTSVTSIVTAHVPGLVPTGITSLTADSSSRLVVATIGMTNDLYVYSPFWNGPEKVQSAWTRWRFADDYEIADAKFLKGKLWLLVTAGNEWGLEWMPTRGIGAETGFDYECYGDRQVELTGSYDGNTDITSFDLSSFGLKAQGCTLNRLLPGEDFGANAGNADYAPVGANWTYNDPLNGSIIKMTGDYSDGEVLLYRFVPYSLTLSDPFRRDQSGRPLLGDRCLVRKIGVSHLDTGEYTITIASGSNKTNATSVFTPPTGSFVESNGYHATMVGEERDRVTLTISSNEPTLTQIAGIQFVCDFSAMLR